MSLGVKLDHLRGPSAPGEKLARVTFRGKFCFEKSDICVVVSRIEFLPKTNKKHYKARAREVI